MPLQESAWFDVKLHWSTDHGELPTIDEVQAILTDILTKVDGIDTVMVDGRSEWNLI